METPSQQQYNFTLILNQLLELITDNCNEGDLLKGANLLKFLNDLHNTKQQLRETAHYRHLQRIRPRPMTTPNPNRKMEVCPKCGRCVSDVKAHQERAVCKDIYAERRNVAQGNAQVLQIIYNKRIDAADTIRKWWLSHR